jgi:hypothetical protein
MRSTITKSLVETKRYDVSADTLLFIEDTWDALLQQIPPVYGNPDAERVAAILNAQMNGEDVTGLKLQMIANQRNTYASQ